MERAVAPHPSPSKERNCQARNDRMAMATCGNCCNNNSINADGNCRKACLTIARPTAIMAA
eukprot:15476792-Alexandrium_andersonii.AAC.1